MKKQPTTGKALTSRSDRCRVLKDGLAANSFRGAIGPDFHERISGHWGLAGAVLFSPPRKFFLKPFSLPDFFPVPGREPANVFNYTLLSQVQMKLALGVSNRMFFEGVTYVSGQASSSKIREQPVVRLSTTSTLREFWMTLSHSLLRAPLGDRERSPRRAFNFVTAPRWPAGIKPPQTGYPGQPGSREVVGPSFTKLFWATQRWLQFLKVAPFRGPSGPAGRQRSTAGGSLPIDINGLATNFILKEQVPAWPALVLRKIVNAAFKAGDQLSQHWSLPSLLIPRARIQVSLAGGPSALSPLTLVVPQRGSREVETNVRTRFAESSTMYFARHESQLVQKLVSALKETRQTQTEIKTAAPPQIEIEHLTRQVYQQLEREIRIEKERRGF